MGTGKTGSMVSNWQLNRRKHAIPLTFQHPGAERYIKTTEADGQEETQADKIKEKMRGTEKKTNKN